MLRATAPFRCNVSSKSADAIIIGAGVIGCNIAFELAKKGYKRVTVVDSKAHAGDGSTGYSSGILRTIYSVEASIAFSWEAYQTWQRWEDYLGLKVAPKGGYPRLRKLDGVFLRSPRSEKFLTEFAERAEKFKIETKWLDYDQAAERVGKMGWDISKNYNPRRIDDPAFDEPDDAQQITGALVMPDTGYISDPRLATQNLAQAATEHGATFRFKSRVTAINQSAGAVTGVTLADGTIIEAPVVLNAAGPWSNRVTEMAFRDPSGPKNDMNLTTRPIRTEVGYCPPPAGVNLERDGFFSFDFDLGYYVRHEFGNKLLVGGIEPDCDPMEWVEGEVDDMDLNLTEQWTAHMYRYALRCPSTVIPSGNAVQGITSTYDVSEDWTPICDKSCLKGYFMAIGTSGNCFKVAPVIGGAMAQLVDRTLNEPGFDHDKTPMKYDLSQVQRVLDFGDFSRLRKLWGGRSVIG